MRPTHLRKALCAVDLEIQEGYRPLIFVCGISPLLSPRWREPCASLPVYGERDLRVPQTWEDVSADRGYLRLRDREYRGAACGRRTGGGGGGNIIIITTDRRTASLTATTSHIQTSSNSTDSVSVDYRFGRICECCPLDRGLPSAGSIGGWRRRRKPSCWTGRQVSYGLAGSSRTTIIYAVAAADSRTNSI